MVAMTSRRAMPCAAALMLLLGAGAGCSDPPPPLCPGGVVCPEPLQCAAKQAACVATPCGNGVRDPGEVCDDGGVTDGDVIDGQRCSANCLSDETCGNETTDTAVGEVCDPPGPNCSDDCTSSSCGNHQVDPPGEECDPGEGSPLETAECDLDCTHRVCGDGTINHAAAEQCDRDGNGVAGPDGRSQTCNSDCTSSRCGDGKTNPLDGSTAAGGEQCDDGDARNGWNASCLPTCIKNVCGDAHLNRTLRNGSMVEDCDSGLGDADPRVDCPYSPNQTSCTLCSVCKLVQGIPHYCGDGSVDSPAEACDLGARNGDTTCPTGQTTCMLCLDHCHVSTPGAGALGAVTR